MDQRGISLIEVVVTAVIIALLASLATLSVDFYIKDGKTRIAEGDLATLASATRLYILDHGFPGSFVPSTALVTAYLPELPVDPFASDGSVYYFEIRSYGGSNQIYIGSRGPDGVVDYGESGAQDDIYRYVR